MAPRTHPVHTALATVLWAASINATASTTAEKAITSTITTVTVHLSGAQVTRTARVELPKGTLRLVFKDLSEEADPASVRVSGTGGFTILSVKHRLDHGTKPEGGGEVEATEARIKAVERSVQDERNRIGLLQNEEQRLLKNEVVEGGQQGTTLERLRAINDYLRERIAAVRSGVLEGERRIGDLKEEAQRLQLRLGQLREKKPRARSEVLVEVAAEKALSSVLTLGYMVRSAGWSPHYDIRVGSLAAPLALTYKANVYQSSGEDWTDVRLELASGDPQRGGAMPQLAIWRLDAGNRPAVVQRTTRPHNASVREVRGIIRDAKTGEPLPFANIAVVTADGSALNGAASGMDGYYVVAVPPGGRALRVTYVGYKPLRMDIHGNSMNLTLEQAVELAAFEVVQYKVPLIDRDGGASGTTITSEDIRRTPGRSAMSIASSKLETGTAQMRGAVAGGTHYYIDGVKVPAGDVSTGGVPANYGDVTGGLIDIQHPEVTIQRGNTHFVLAITLPYTIPSDGQGHTVAVKEHQVAAVYRHYCVPKLDPAAHLFAKATGWDALDLLPGPANLYYEGTYIGETFIDSEQVGDTLDISLGHDRGVVVRRVKRTGFSGRRTSGNRRTETISWAIEARNTKGEAIELVLMDHIPVPVRSEIEVSLTQHDATAVDDARGFLTWRATIAPRSAIERSFTYAVRVPRAMPLVLE